MKYFIFIFIAVSAACKNDRSHLSNKSIEDVAGNAEVSNFMKNFEGRGDLTDTSHALTPAQSLAHFKVANDLRLELVLSEPAVTQPVFITFDSRGRLWVVQYNQYPYPEGLKVTSMDQHVRSKFDKLPKAPPENAKGADKITMFEDADGDGTFEKSTDVITGLNLITSVAFGRGQIWVLNPPFLLAYPDADQNGIPDGSPVVCLEGFGIEDTHAVANNLRFGPDGWLYGAQGSTCTADISSAVSKNVKFSGQAIWRYHPVTKVFEVFAEGGGNTFDIEIDEKGRLYSGDNGTARGQYYKQGAYFVRNLGKHGDYTNPYTFGRLNNMALSGEELRFTHAFVKYNGGSFPSRYNQKMIAINPLQSFVQLTTMEQNGSTIKNTDEERIIQTDDHWFRPVDIVSGPDGNVYIADWYDSRISHVDPRDTWDKNSGRIYVLKNKSGEHQQTAKTDLSSLDDNALIQLLSHKNIWYRQQALLLIGDRKNKSLLPKLMPVLNSSDGQLSLEALWAINACGGFDSAMAKKCLQHTDPFVRMWAVRLIGDSGERFENILPLVVALAHHEVNAEVRSQLAATAKRLHNNFTVDIIRALLNKDDAADPDIPLQTWWALESVAESYRDDIVKMFSDKTVWSKSVVYNVLLNRLIERYMLAGGEQNIGTCAKLFSLAPGEKYAAKLFDGLQEGLRGRDPRELSPVLADAIKPYKGLFASETLVIEMRSGNKIALVKALKMISDPSVSLPLQLEYIKVLGEVKYAAALPELINKAEQGSPSMRQAALLALQNFDSPEIGERIVKAYPDRLRNDYDVRESALTLFASRPTWATLLINAISRERKPGETFIAHTIDKSDVPGHIVRQMKLLGDKELIKSCDQLWPEVRTSTPEKKNKLIASVATSLREGKGNTTAGYPLFIAKCSSCHKLFNDGRNIAPDLTGYDRKNLHDLLNNIVDPSAYIREGYETWHLVTRNGRTVIGTMKSKSANSVTLQPFTGDAVTISSSDVKTLEQMKVSMMPEHLLDNLQPQQIRDFFSYLMK
jgi:putative heme-binding domain-containing protein